MNSRSLSYNSRGMMELLKEGRGKGRGVSAYILDLQQNETEIKLKKVSKM